MPSKPAAKKVTPEEKVVATMKEPVKSKKTVAPVKEVEPVVQKAKTSKATKEPVKTETVDVAPVVDANVVVEETSLSTDFTTFIGNFQELIARFGSLKTELKTLEKKTNKQLKIVQKLKNKKMRKGTRAPSGFVKPSPISDELAKFLGKEKGIEMARTDVTREINKYIHEHKLQDKENGRKIIPDKQLSQLLGIDDTVNLTYFNLQKYMSPHFPKIIKEVTPAVVV